MKTKSIIVLLLVLASISGFAQRQADLTKFVKIADNAFGPISDIDSMTKILTDRFIAIANDPKSETHTNIQSFFDGYKQNPENIESSVYPATLKKEDLTIQFIDYSYNYGWIGQAMDSVFNTSSLTSLILIPAIDNVHKGQVVNTICFKVTLEIYTESNMKTDKDYKKEENITELKKIDLSD